MEPTFKPGDLVYLKSGSARLTITRVHRNEFQQVYEADLAWMNYETQELRQARLPVDALEPAGDRTARNG